MESVKGKGQRASSGGGTAPAARQSRASSAALLRGPSGRTSCLCPSTMVLGLLVLFCSWLCSLAQGRLRLICDEKILLHDHV
ncbi:unnamed protein product [Lota lota]